MEVSVRSDPSGRVSRVTLVDGTADVWLIGPGEDTWHFFGSRPAVDFTRAVGAHRADEVLATMRFLNLRRVRPQDFTVRIRSSEGFRRAIVSTGPGSWGGNNRLLDLRERVRDCPGLRHDIDYGRDRVVVRIPRECLGNPTWVRLAISAYLFRPRNELSDNPHNARAVPTFTRRLQPMPG